MSRNMRQGGLMESLTAIFVIFLYIIINNKYIYKNI